MGYNKDTGLYELEDIAFVNTSLFTEAARHYKKHGCYTFAPDGSREHKEFWDIEEDRRKNGMTVPGKLITKTAPNGMKYQEIQNVHITGKHYGFLNYGRIKLTKDADSEELKYQTGNKPKHARKVGKKEIDFPRFIDGQYHWFKAKQEATLLGLNLIASKARRKGFSYMEGFDCADEINMNREVLCIVTAFDMKYLTKGNQILPMCKRYLDWFENETDFGRGYLKEELDYIKLGFKKPGEGHKEYGYKSEIIGLSMMNNPDAPAGKDAVLIKFEESGKNPILKEALSITMSTTEDGGYTTGRIDIFGTGGTKDANWKDFEDIYYNPTDYNCLAFDNIWDEGSRGTPAGFFYPQQVGDPLYLDKEGNSLQAEALKHHEMLKESKKKTLTQSAYIRWTSQRATCGREAFASGSDNIFPTAELSEQRNIVSHNNDYKYLAREGQLIRTGTGVRFKSNDLLRAEGLKAFDPIRDYPLKKEDNPTGCYVEWFSPYKDPVTGKVPDNLYRIFHDPYAHDKDTKEILMNDSLGVSYVYEQINNFTPGRGGYLVASYIGRPPRVDDYNENLLKMAEYWNAKIMFENDRGDVKGYFGRAKKMEYLVDEPELEWIAALKGKTKRGKGINMTPQRKAQAVIYLRDWLTESRGKDSFGNEKMNLHYIYDVGLLSELLRWGIKGNFDRVSALLVGMYDIKETVHVKIIPSKKRRENSFFTHKMFTND